MFLSVACILSSCSVLKMLPDYSKIEKVLNKEISTEHFIYHMSKDDSVKQYWEENYYNWLTKKLNITPTEKIHYYKYKDVNQKYLLTGSKGNAITLDDRIHTVIPYDNHELVHVLVGKYIGNPPKMFTEGIAVAHQTNPFENDFIPKWGKEPIDKIVYELNGKSQIPPLDSLLVMSQYFKYSENITYPISGSFVKYLLQIYGYEKFYEFIKECDWKCS